MTGGAGYIGAHVVDALLRRGEEVVVADDLSTGDRGRIPGIPVLELDLAAAGARPVLAEGLREHRVDAIVHLAARKKVDESVERPEWYRAQNVGGVATVLDAAADAGVARLVFSSTAAVYAAATHPVTEDDETAPANPYGETKLTGERMLADRVAAGLRSVSLRYFNVAGAARPELADIDGSNIVPLVFARLEQGLPPVVFGDDYATPDGTCVRDYVHVADVADAHLVALDALADPAASARVYNIGTGRGVSVLEMMRAMSRAAGVDIDPEIAPRRAGDPAIVVADTSRIRAQLGWSATRTLDEALASEWAARTR